jgi:uncharacterized membrane protein
MTTELVLLLVVVGELVVMGAIMLILPRVTRRGLLFGAYVGPELAAGEAARRITRSWYGAMSLVIAMTLSAGAVFALAVEEKRYLLVLAAQITLPTLLIGGFVVCCVRAYRSARRLAPEVAAPPVAAASLMPVRGGYLLPAVTLLTGAAVGLSCLAYASYAWSQDDRLPEHMPWGVDGGADAWSIWSLASVYAWPLTTLLVGLLLGGLSFLVASAKRAVRAADGGVSLAAAQRFRTAMVWFVFGAALLATALFADISVEAIRCALGQAEENSLAPWVILVGLLVYGLGGTVVIALRVGQGGARLEKAVAAAPLTDGLADNTKWKLGMFYVNRDDPSVFVEGRFGLGHTLNLGNPRAVALLVVILLALLVPALLSLLLLL